MVPITPIVIPRPAPKMKLVNDDKKGYDRARKEPDINNVPFFEVTATV